MKWLRRQSILFFLVLSLLGPVGFLSADQSSPTYASLLKELTSIWSELNSLSVNSSMTLADIQKEFPIILERLSNFEADLVTFEADLQSSLEKSEQLETGLMGSLMELQTLKDLFSKLSDSVESSRISFTNIEDSVNRAVRRSNTGLFLAILAASMGVSLLGYEIWQGSQE